MRAVAQEAVSPNSERQQLLEWRSGDEKHRVATIADWRIRREQILHGFQLASGSLPDHTRMPPLDLQVIDVDDSHPRYRMQKIRFVAEPNDRVPAWLLLPKPDEGRGQRRPAMLALHQTNDLLGKDEPVGRGGSQNLCYAKELAERGYVVLVPDYPSFGDYEYDFAASPYASGTIKGVLNHQRAIDLLVEQTEVDSTRIGVIGHSLGGHNAIFLGVFDERVKVVVSSCGWTPFADYYQGDLTGWTSPRYMPLIQTRYNSDPNLVPFDFYELIAALAPRAFFSNSPLHDTNFNVDGVRKVQVAVAPVLRLHGTESQFMFEYHDAAHDFPPDVRERAYAFIDKILRDPKKQ